ncbi:hypothetical protein BB8028_0010g00390 [Beauveria bassiana]|uniref:C2H2-type domain-containing protein n=1 Tax=Beauveria bassiana TaxID=176275 RepID=A0A2S7YPE0_BEABA|nr:hypothetical protein BB8028_0010g00390 [Beauveria bassiana]
MPWDGQQHIGAGGLYHCPEPQCTSSPFQLSCDLRHHFKNHYKPVSCPIQTCEYRSGEQREMKRHFQEIHAPHTIKWHFCPYPNCGSQFARREYVKRHIKALHPNFSAGS